MFMTGDTVTISGTNTVSGKAYLKLTNMNTWEDRFLEVSVNPDKSWSHSFTPAIGGYIIYASSLEGTNFMDSQDFATAGFTVARSLPKIPTPTPTPEPTPDYSAKIAQLEKKVAEQDTKIATLQNTPTPVIAEVTAPTPSPTATPNYEATIAAMQTQIEEQGSWIDAILRFLGLK
jgi:hypothetical protein